MKVSDVPAAQRRPILSARVLNEIADERQRAEEKFPDQHLPFGTGPDVVWMPPIDRAEVAARYLKGVTDAAAANGTLTWAVVILEELAEAFAESDPRRLHDELVQLANTAMRAAEDALVAEDGDLW
jgi:hypothetical protein